MTTLVTNVTMVACVTRVTNFTTDILVAMLMDLPVVIFATVVPKITKVCLLLCLCKHARHFLSCFSSYILSVFMHSLTKAKELESHLC